MPSQRPSPAFWHMPSFSLAANDPAVFEREDYGRAFPALVVCDHASNAVPHSLASLGLSDSARQDHIAWDVGAAALARSLAQRLQLPLIKAGYSRLVIDCNRHLEDPASILPVSDFQPVPGNRNLTPVERAARVRAIFEPYHAAIEVALGEISALVPAPALIAVHSFTPLMQGFRRPWHCGILWDKDPRMPLPLLAALRAHRELIVGDNEPYSGRDPSDYTISVHAKQRGWPHVCIEVRQDLLESAVGVEEWSERLAENLAATLANKSLYEVATF